MLVLSPAREVGTRFRWTGSRITEVLVGTVGAVAITATACVLTHELWGLPMGGLETAAYPLAIGSIVVIALQPDRNLIGQVFYASYAAASLASVTWAAYISVVAPHSIAETVTASLVIILDPAAALVWLSNINYPSDVLCRARRGRPLPKADPCYQPIVSLHMPAYNEPPELLIETIKAVERIDYPNFEIVVIDNNTKDPAVWGPVEEYCRDRPRVKFVHVAPWPGYKAGACNLALRRYIDLARRDHRPGRRRRHRPALLPARDRPVLLRPEPRLRADLRGQPRIRGQPLLHRLRGLLPGLLPVATCRRATSATRSRSSGRWACSGAAR